MAAYKLIMLDFDGTTACTVHAIHHAAKRMLNSYGYEVNKEVVYKNFGLALPYAFYCFAGVESFDEETSRQMTADYNRIYREEAEPLIELFEGVPQTLDTLKKAGIQIVIASNNVHPVLERQLTNLGIREYIDDIVAVEDVENVKPAPDIALEVLRRTGVAPSEALVVGDSTYDMDMGRGAGCDLCGVSYGGHTPDMLRKAGAKYIIDNFAELANIAING